MDWQARITFNPDILVGIAVLKLVEYSRFSTGVSFRIESLPHLNKNRYKPIIKGTRLAVEFIIDLLAQGWSTDEILRN